MLKKLTSNSEESCGTGGAGVVLKEGSRGADGPAAAGAMGGSNSLKCDSFLLLL